MGNNAVHLCTSGKNIILKHINENTTLTTHPTLTKQLEMKDFMLTEVSRTAKYTEVYSEFVNVNANLMSNTGSARAITRAKGS